LAVRDLGRRSGSGFLIGQSGALAGSRLETRVSKESSAFGPALLFLVDQGLVMAWVGINEARTVNVATLDLPAGSTAVNVRNRVFVNGGGLGGGGAGPPALSPFDPLPMSLACLNDSGELCLASARSGLNFQSPDPVSWAAPLQEGAALSFLHAAWTRSDDNQLEFVRVPFGPTSFARSAQTCVHKPSLAEFRGELHVAWVGTDGNGQLNVAPIDHAAWDAGGDPIDASQVNTLNEFSIAAPALMSLPNPERLAIFWTGTDGAGALNGGVVS
jgi:hypothetical protein